MTTATGAIISHSAHTTRAPVQTALSGVAVEVMGGLPAHPPVVVPPLAGPDDVPVLGMGLAGLAGPGVYPSYRGGMGGRRGEREGKEYGMRDERGRERERDRDRDRERERGGEREGKGGKNSKQYAFVELPEIGRAHV